MKLKSRKIVHSKQGRVRKELVQSIPSVMKIHTGLHWLDNFYSGKLKMWLPWSLRPDVLQSRVSEVDPEVCEVGVGPPPQSQEMDIRPHIFDPVLQMHVLVDSGSQVSAFPPDPGDKPDPKLNLKAANGSRIKGFGFKDISIKIGRKPYHFKIIKAEVEAPILGWDFFRKFRLDLIWGEFGDIWQKQFILAIFW